MSDEVNHWQEVAIPYWLRWQVHQRLQELAIPALCLPNSVENSLQVEVSNVMAAVQLRSVVQQFRASRPELVAWLEQCWRLPPHAPRC